MQATVAGLPALAAIDGALDRAGVAVTSRLLAALVEALVEQARALAPLRTGALRDSIRPVLTGGGIVVEASAPYALYVLAGVSPQYMTWLLGKTVSFVARDGTRVTRRVTFVGERNGTRHWYQPGIPARDFFRRAWESGPVQAVVEQLRAEGVQVAIAFLYPPAG